MAHGPDQAVLGLGRPATNVPVNQPGVLDEAEDNDLDQLAGTQAELTAHEADTSTHGVATVAGVADITTHESDTSTHGVTVVAGTADIATHEALTQTVGVHGLPRVTLAAGTAAAANVTIAGLLAGDTLVSVLSFTTAAAIASVADRTAEYVTGAGVLTKSAGTNETGNQLIIFWVDKA